MKPFALFALLLLFHPALALAKPNIVIILADDMGYGDLQILNAKSKIPTPHLDALSRSGATFLDAHSGSAVCTPTRYGLLTGRYCWR
ncbi:MAG: sulfatase-like hydrolase/transferase, partial [Roseibacillus sp.]|nr:sulfatase-like hydrolase/transferase [Roseibacillus sp.]